MGGQARIVVRIRPRQSPGDRFDPDPMCRGGLMAASNPVAAPGSRTAGREIDIQPEGIRSQARPACRMLVTKATVRSWSAEPCCATGPLEHALLLRRQRLDPALQTLGSDRAVIPAETVAVRGSKENTSRIQQRE